MVEYEAASLAYWTFVTVLQAGLGYYILIRRPRAEWCWVLAALFLLNAGVSAPFVTRGLLGATHPAHSALVDAGGWFDPITTILIAYLALRFPRPVRAFEGRTGSLRVLVLGTGLTALLFMRAFGLESPFGDRMLSTWVLYGFVPLVAWMGVLVRWAVVLTEDTSPALLRPFQFVFAAIAIRAANLGIYEPFRYVDSNLNTAWEMHLLIGGLYFLHLVALLFAFTWLLYRRGHTWGLRRDAVDFVLLFMVLGVIEGALSIAASGYGWNVSFLNGLDLYVIRPALVWFAVVRLDVLDRRVRSPTTALCAVAFLALISVTFQVALVNADGDRLATPDFLSAFTQALVLSAVIGGAMLPFMRRQVAVPTARPAPIRPDTGSEAPLADRIELYIACVEERAQALGSREPGSGRVRVDTQTLQRRFHIPGEIAKAIDRAVVERWGRSGHTWEEGQLVLGRYRLGPTLGKGGSGVAMLAHDIVEDRDVVLKRARVTSPEAARLVGKEARALARVIHPNVIEVLCVEVVDGQPVLVIEHHSAGTLRHRIDEHGALPEPEVRRLANDILGGLAALHARGLMHRDIKPANILFARDGRAVVADLGTARRAPSPRRLGDPTETAFALGTTKYMAPEQTHGEDVDVRADLFAVGLVIAEALSGKKVLHDRDETAVRQATQDAVAAAPVSWRPWLAKALAFDPGERFDHASAMRRALPKA